VGHIFDVRVHRPRRQYKCHPTFSFIAETGNFSNIRLSHWLPSFDCHCHLFFLHCSGASIILNTRPMTVTLNLRYIFSEQTASSNRSAFRIVAPAVLQFLLPVCSFLRRQHVLHMFVRLSPGCNIRAIWLQERDVRFPQRCPYLLALLP